MKTPLLKRLRLLKNLPRCGPSTVQPLPQSALVVNISRLISLVLDSIVTHAIKHDISGYTTVKQSNSTPKNIGDAKTTQPQISIARPVVNDQCKVRLTDTIRFVSYLRSVDP